MFIRITLVQIRTLKPLGGFHTMRFLTLAAIAALILPATTSVEVIEAAAPSENAAPPAPAPEDNAPPPVPGEDPAKGEETPEEAPDINENPDDEESNSIVITNPDFTQPVVKEMPKSDDAARDTIKKAYESVYSARMKGLKKFACDLNVTVSFGQMGGPVSVKTKTAWKSGDEDLSVKISDEQDGNDANNPMAPMVRQQIAGSIPELTSLLDMLIIGGDVFDVHFKDHAFANEKDGRVRVWFNNEDDGQLMSVLTTIKDGIVTKMDGAVFRLGFEYEKKGRDNVAKAVTTSQWVEMPDRFGGVSSQEMAQTFKVTEFATEGAYTIGTKISCTADMGGMTYTITTELSGIAVDDKVTDAMLKAAKGEEGDSESGETGSEEGSESKEVEPEDKIVEVPEENDDGGTEK
ncbi:MAG: hypothetical protein L6Q71_00865 [Planctomycetes bacterium]|nr:hypothetical protein [Planctomycetota bacterium]NUQ33573.1 hypothetical protein [Planctomycetaceae bacterium]